jgi:hypothetical protein
MTFCSLSPLLLTHSVMAGLVPAIHVFPWASAKKDVDARHKAGHDDLVGAGEVKEEPYPTSPFIAFTGALSGNTVSASTRSATPR